LSAAHLHGHAQTVQRARRSQRRLFGPDQHVSQGPALSIHRRAPVRACGQGPRRADDGRRAIRRAGREERAAVDFRGGAAARAGDAALGGLRLGPGLVRLPCPLCPLPAVIFIWPHAGRASHEQVATVVSSHANVMVTLSKKEHRARSLSSEEKAEMLGEGVIDDCGVLRREWRDLFVRYPERFMFATDAHKSFRWAKYEAIVERWRLILGQLPEPLAQSLAWRNAERVYGMAR